VLRVGFLCGGFLLGFLLRFLFRVGDCCVYSGGNGGEHGYYAGMITRNMFLCSR